MKILAVTLLLAALAIAAHALPRSRGPASPGGSPAGPPSPSRSRTDTRPKSDGLPHGHEVPPQLYPLPPAPPPSNDEEGDDDDDANSNPPSGLQNMPPPSPQRSPYSGYVAAPGGPPSAGNLPHGIPQRPGGQAPPQGPSEALRTPIMPFGGRMGGRPGSNLPDPSTVGQVDLPDPETGTSFQLEEPTPCNWTRYRPDPTNCSRYLVCVNGWAQPMPCPATLQWDNAKQTCNHRWVVRCRITTTSTQRPTTTSVEPRGEIPSPDDVDKDCPEFPIIRFKKLQHGLMAAWCIPGKGYRALPPCNLEADEPQCVFELRDEDTLSPSIFMNRDTANSMMGGSLPDKRYWMGEGGP